MRDAIETAAEVLLLLAWFGVIAFICGFLNYLVEVSK